MDSIIRTICTIFYSLLYINSRIGFYGLKYLYSGISVIDKRLPGNTKKWTLVGVRLVHPWADCSTLYNGFLTILKLHLNRVLEKAILTTFLRAKVCYSNGNVKFENFMQMEWSEEKFLKGIVGRLSSNPCTARGNWALHPEDLSQPTVHPTE